MVAPAVYRYLFHNPTGSPSSNFMGELQGIYGVNMTRHLSKPGDMTFAIRGDGMINSPTPTTPPMDVILPLTQPFGSSIWVYRNDKLVWAGLITSRTWQSELHVMNFTASTHDRYLQAINCNSNVDFALAPPFGEYPANLIYKILLRVIDNTYSLANNVWPHPAGQPFSPTEMVCNPLTGLIGPTYALSAGVDRAPEFWELIDSVLKLGAEYRLVPKDTAGTYPRTVEWQLGQEDGDTTHKVGKDSSEFTFRIQYPGSIYRYWWSESVGTRSGAADIVLMRGKSDTTGATPKRDVYPFTPDRLRMSRRVDFDFTVQADLDSVSTNTFLGFKPPIVNPTFELDPSHPDVSVYMDAIDVGDYIKYIVDDTLRFGSNTQVGVKRVIGISLSPPSESSTEQFGIQLEEPS